MEEKNSRLDIEEFEALINQNRLKLYKTAMAILRNSEDVNDAIQETLLSAYKNLDRLKNKEYFTTWIITILRNNCFDIIKKNKKIVSVDDAFIENTDSYYDTYKSDSSVERVLNELDEDLKEITVLYYYDEFSIKEISSIMNIPEGTVKSRLSRAREKIRELLEKWGDVNG